MEEKNKLGFKFVSAKNGNKTLIFDDGTKLTGNFSKWESYVAKVGVEIDVKSNFPNYGTYEYTDGSTYEGELKNGVRHGLGKTTFPDGRFFYGEFKDSEFVKELRDEKEKENFKKIIKIFKPKKNNDETYSFTNPGEKQINLLKKDIFLFDLIRSILTDNVDMKWQSMVDGSSEVLSGKGVLDKLFKKYKNYEISLGGAMKKKIKFDIGEYYGETNEKGLAHGRGIFTYFNGSKFEGEFKNDLHSGQGTLIKKNGDTYIGNFSDGKFNGNGKWQWEGEDFLNSYEGEFKNHKMHGKGKLTRSAIAGPNKNIMIIEYIGDFVEDSIVKGTWHTKVKGIIEGSYEGEFKDNAFDGNGVLTVYYDDDENYVKAGAWKRKGKWKNGKLQTSFLKNISQKLFGK